MNGKVRTHYTTAVFNIDTFNIADTSKAHVAPNHRHKKKMQTDAACFLLNTFPVDSVFYLLPLFTTLLGLSLAELQFF